MAEVKMLAITHHDPDHEDEFLKKIEKNASIDLKNVFLQEKRWKLNCEKLFIGKDLMSAFIKNYLINKHCNVMWSPTAVPFDNLK